MLQYPLLFVQRLSDHDLELLATVEDAPSEVSELRRRLTRDPAAVEPLIAHPELFEMLFRGSETGLSTGLTPLLAFAVLVHRAARDLASASYVSEWVGAGERLPVFDVNTLREFIDDITRRYLIIEFLTSFTRVASGSVWVRTERGYRRRRYSELDPVGLAEMVETLPREQRAPGYRRLGDVALFLTGVFPDHTARHPLSPMSRARLATFAGVRDDGGLERDYLRFLEVVGTSWYHRAAATPFLSPVVNQPLEEMAANFTQARRFLNYLTDRYFHSFDTALMNPVG
ncbi:MAG TPA: hypothetical protein VMQ46_05035 [Acidimicrobiia bacterium]|nr:hypothetical protein [Acidimicrobiia bacterium]